MIVADCNLISYLLIPGEFSDYAQKVFQKDFSWIVPLLWRSEFRNVLSSYIRKQIIDIKFALLIMNEAISILENNEFEVKSNQVLNLVTSSNCSAYDCEYVSLAQELNIPLVTMDKRILREFPKTAVNIIDFAK